MWIRRLVTIVGALALLTAGLAIAPAPSHAAGPTDRLFWSADTGGGDQLWGSTAGTVSSAVALPSGTPTGIYRSLATDGTNLYFSDGANLVRTALDGTGKATVVAGVTSPGQIVVAGSTLYYSLWDTGVWSVAASSTNGTASNILSNASSSGWDGIAVSGSTLYAINYYTGGLYQATINGSSAATVTVTNSDSSVMNGAVSQLLADGSTVYAAGSNGSIKFTTDVSLQLSAWSSIGTTPLAGTVYSIAKLDDTLYFTMGTEVASIKTDGTSGTRLSSDGQFGSAWAIAALAPATFAVTYNGNGSTGGGVPVDSSSPYVDGSTVAVLGNTGTLTKTDNQFYGYWRLDDATSGTLKAPGSTFTISQNTTLYAQWVGGPLAYSLSSGGPIVTTAAFPATANGQTSTMTVYMRNTGATTYPNVANGGGGVGAPISSTCPSGGGTAFLMNAECQFTLQWTASGNLSNTFSYSYGGPSPAYLTLTGTMLNAARVPAFDTPVRTADGYTVNLTNWDSSWTWTPSVGSGSVAAGSGAGSTLPLTVSGLAASASATLTMQTTRSGYADGSATVTSSALASARTPLLDTPVPTADGYTVNVTNWDTNWTWTPSTGAGSVTAGTPTGTTLPLTVTGLAAGASATVTMTAGRTGYVTGTAAVTGTALPASGGGGGGGDTSTSTPPQTTPTTPTTVTPSTPVQLGPQDSPSTSRLLPGETLATLGGQQVPVATTTVPKSGSVSGSGVGWTVTVGGRTPSGRVQPLTSTGGVQIQQGGGVHVSGSGYAAGSTVMVYSLQPALLLGSVTVGADGSFAGTVTLPAAITPGRAVIQLNGYASAGVVRSYSLGVKVVRNSTVKVRTVTATVYFAAGSSWLNPTARAVLDGLATAVPKGAQSVSVVCKGYVQGTPSTSNDFTLSTQRAVRTAAHLKADRLSGKFYATGRGIAKDPGAKGRKVIVTITYKVR